MRSPRVTAPPKRIASSCDSTCCRSATSSQCSSSFVRSKPVMKGRIRFSLFSAGSALALMGGPSADAAHALHAQAQVCDDLYGFDNALQCKAGTQGPAIPSGVATVEDDDYVRKDPDSNAVVISFRGLVQSF